MRSRNGAVVNPPTYTALVRFRTRGPEGVKLVVGSLLCPEKFFSDFLLSKFLFDRMQGLPENHFRVRGASWVNIVNYY